MSETKKLAVITRADIIHDNAAIKALQGNVKQRDEQTRIDLQKLLVSSSLQIWHDGNIKPLRDTLDLFPRGAKKKAAIEWALKWNPIKEETTEVEGKKVKQWEIDKPKRVRGVFGWFAKSSDGILENEQDVIDIETKMCEMSWETFMPEAGEPEKPTAKKVVETALKRLKNLEGVDPADVKTLQDALAKIEADEKIRNAVHRFHAPFIVEYKDDLEALVERADGETAFSMVERAYQMAAADESMANRLARLESQRQKGAICSVEMRYKLVEAWILNQ